MPESWVPVPGYEGIYEVSDQGRVRSLDRIIQHPQGPQHRAGRVLTQDTDRKGYRGVVLCHGEQRRFQVHRLVLLAFVGPAPLNYQACHSNGVPGDNRLANLRWGSPTENAADRKIHGTEHNTNKTHCKRGHEFTSENTYQEKNRRHRKCRECARENDRKRRKHA